VKEEGWGILFLSPWSLGTFVSRKKESKIPKKWCAAVECEEKWAKSTNDGVDVNFNRKWSSMGASKSKK
jgi:hypothetical protein